jgi:hypothetical protein
MLSVPQQAQQGCQLHTVVLIGQGLSGAYVLKLKHNIIIIIQKALPARYCCARSY